MSEIGALLWWNRIETAAALIWHEAATAARVATVDELGAVCRIALTPPPGVRMASLLPPDLSYLRHGGDAALLGSTIVRLLGGAAKLRVLAAQAIDAPNLFAAGVAAFQPDVIALADGLAAPALSQPDRARTLPGWTVHCADELVAAVEGWHSLFEERIRHRHGLARRYRIDELASSGLPTLDPAANWACLSPGRPATLLLPGCHARAVRVRLHLVRPPASDAATELQLDGATGRVQSQPGCIEARFDDMALVAAHRLEIAHDGPDDLLVIAAEIAPA